MCWSLFTANPAGQIGQLRDVDAAVTQAREYLRPVGYPAAGWPAS